MAAHRYWRLTIHNSNGSTTGSLAEIQMRVTPGGPTVCSGGSASASSTYDASHLPENAFDGTSAPWAMANGQSSGWIQYDFGSGNPQDIVEFAITARPAWLDQCPKDFELIYSDDGIYWSLGTRINNQTGWTANETRAYSYAEVPIPEIKIISHFKEFHEPRFEIHNLPLATIRSTFVGEGKVSGRITVEGSIANNALVRLVHSNSGFTVQETTSNVLGMYEFNNVKLGELYDVVAEDPLKEWEKVVSSRREPKYFPRMMARARCGESANCILTRNPNASYWRLLINTYNMHPSVAELQMFNLISGSNLCTGGTAISSGDYSVDFPASEAFDGNLAGTPGLGWAAESATADRWIGYQFPSPTLVTEFRIIGRVEEYPVDFQIQFSNDGSTWYTTKTYTGQNLKNSNGLQSFSAE